MQVITWITHAYAYMSQRSFGILVATYCGELCHGNSNGGDDENTQVHSINDVASDGVTGQSVSFVQYAYRASTCQSF